tara:strand:- start:348 stop:1481 length:1134 start_codon:yes stop_codon:yes gene_type:complete
MELTIQQALEQATTAHKDGNLQDAERLYRAILQAEPANADANHNMGSLALSSGQVEAALPFFKIALDAMPSIEQFWVSYIDTLVKNNQLKDAKLVVERAKKEGMDAKNMDALLIQPKPMEEIRILYENCPLCESNNISKSVVGDCSQQSLYNRIIPPIMQWMDCEDCQHQFINGHFTDEALEVIFSITPEHTTFGHNFEEGRKLAARMIDAVAPYQSCGTWLDVGFGNGSLLLTADEYGYEPIGVDLREDGVVALKAEGIQAHCDLVQNIEFEKSISVVSMMDVLEHIPYPKEVLMSMHSIMDEDGILLVSMPNSESWLWKFWSRENKNPYFNTIEHYHNFSKTRLVSLLDECGFTFKKYRVSERYRSGMEIIAQRN